MHCLSQQVSTNLRNRKNSRRVTKTKVRTQQISHPSGQAPSGMTANNGEKGFPK